MFTITSDGGLVLHQCVTIIVSDIVDSTIKDNILYITYTFRQWYDIFNQ